MTILLLVLASTVFAGTLLYTSILLNEYGSVLTKGNSLPSKTIVFVWGSPVIVIPPVPTNNTLLFTLLVRESNAIIEFC